MPKTISLYLLLLFLFSAPLPLLIAQEDRESDFNSKVASLVNKVRAYSLRAQSLDELASAYPDKVFPVLVSLLKDPQENPPLRYLASQKLSQINQERAVKVFREILENRGEDPLARRIALAQLVTLREKEMKQKIRDILDDRSEDPAARQYALGIYSGWKEAGKIQKLRDFVDSREETLGMRANALFSLESLKDLDFVRSRIHQFLPHKSEPAELRKNGVILVGRLQDRDALPILVKIAQDGRESSTLRQLVLATLGNIGTATEAAALEGMLRREFDKTLREALQSAITSIKNRKQDYLTS